MQGLNKNFYQKQVPRWSTLFQKKLTLRLSEPAGRGFGNLNPDDDRDLPIFEFPKIVETRRNLANGVINQLVGFETIHREVPILNFILSNGTKSNQTSRFKSKQQRMIPTSALDKIRSVGISFFT